MRRRVLPSPAFCLALLALFVSLGGTTYAITALPRDSVGTAQIRDRAVTEDELSNSAVITRKLANGAVTQRKIAPGAITGSRVAADSLGGAQIDESTLLSVPFAQQADVAKLATRAQVADRVERVGRADAADHATLADRATEADHAERADLADDADKAAVANALGEVDMEFDDTVVVPEGDFGFFQVRCAAEPELVPINGGFIPTDDINDPPVVVGSAPLTDEASWFVVVKDPDSDPPPDDADTPGVAYVVCVRADTLD
jgi:hypothetical protein